MPLTASGSWSITSASPTRRSARTSPAESASWREELEQLAATQEALRNAVARFPEARLHENVPGNGHSYWYELLGILHHDLYHAGQIALLKKAVG